MQPILIDSMAFTHGVIVNTYRYDDDGTKFYAVCEPEQPDREFLFPESAGRYARARSTERKAYRVTIDSGHDKSPPSNGAGGIKVVSGKPEPVIPPSGDALVLDPIF